jgi:hypothetical protein
MRSLNAEFGLRTVKIMDIGFVTAIYFLLGTFLAKLFDTLCGDFDEEKEHKKSLVLQTVEIIGMMWLYGIIIYFIRNLVELIPFPFDGLYGFNHRQLKELQNAGVFTFIFLYSQQYFKDKLFAYYNRITIPI